MDVREKLVEVLNGVQHYGTICTMSQMDDRYASITQVSNTEVAERLIANGVTVQEWISAEDRLPEKEGTYLAYTEKETIHLDCFCIYHNHGTQFWVRGNGKVTHWMPLPQPPKGE